MNHLEFVQEALRLYEKYSAKYQLGTFFNKKDKNGNWLVDCTGLLKAIIWHYPEYGSYIKEQDQNDQMMLADSIESGPINSIPEIPGLIVWQAGHAGIYLGNGKVLESTAKIWQNGKGNGLVISQFKDPNGEMYRGTWEKWFKYRYINYEIKEEGMNDQYTKTTYNGLVIHVAKVGKQEGVEYQGSVTGNKYGTANAAQRSIYMEDHVLEKDGWKSFVNVNGSLFYTYENTTYAEGIEKCCGEVHQDWDTEFDSIPAIGFKKDGTMIIETQHFIRNHLNEFYGACTTCFGVLMNGIAYERPLKHTSQYDSISGRTLIGFNPLGQIVVASFSGVTGKSGLKGSQLSDLARFLGMTDCVCMDGGGSVYFSTEGAIKLNTTRAVKNDVIIYRREKKTPETVFEEAMPSADNNEKINNMMICTASKKLNIREQPVSGKVLVTVGTNEFIEILEFLDGLKSDGYQWAKVRWNGIIGYSQIDTAYTALKEKV